MCLLLSRGFLYQSFVRYFLRNPSIPRTPLHMSHHVSIELRKFVSKFGSSFRSSEAKFPPNFRTSKRNWELGNELRNRVLKSELKSTISHKLHKLFNEGFLDFLVSEANIDHNLLGSNGRGSLNVFKQSADCSECDCL